MAVTIYKTILKFKKLRQQVVLPYLLPQLLTNYGNIINIF